MSFFQKIIRFFRTFFMNRSIKKLLNCIETGLLDDFLELLLKAVRLVTGVDPKYRRNIQGFEAGYAFQSLDGSIAASALFKDNKMKVKKNAIPGATITVYFKDGKSLWEFLMQKDPDVFKFVLESRLSYKGNLNYLMKFAYMAKHLKLEFGL